MGRRRPPICFDCGAAGDLDFVVAGCLPLFDEGVPAVEVGFTEAATIFGEVVYGALGIFSGF